MGARCGVQTQGEWGREVSMVLPSWVQMLHGVTPVAIYSPAFRERVRAPPPAARRVRRAG